MRTLLLLAILVAAPGVAHGQQRDSARKGEPLPDCPIGVADEPKKTADRMPVLKPGEGDSASPAPMPTARPPCRNPADAQRPKRDSTSASPPR
jgi:hypothetical protein